MTSDAQGSLDVDLEQWVRLYEPGLRAFVRVHADGGTADDIDDIVQEVWIRALQYRFNEVVRPMSWLRSTAISVIRDGYRKRTAKKRGGRDIRTDVVGDLIAEIADSTAFAAGTGVPPEDLAIYVDVINTLRTLPLQLRHVAYLMVFEGANQAEVARELGKSPTAIGHWILQARAALKPHVHANPDGFVRRAAMPERGTA